MPRYRLYADAKVVHEDDFEEYDLANFGDDYSIHTVPEGDEDIYYWEEGVPKAIIDHIKEKAAAPLVKL